ncbi:MAG TPA: lycopene cyclase domain-containing protein [Micromonosporaceae bacterium]|jgi:lycopene cyclase domain-containing protein
MAEYTVAAVVAPVAVVLLELLVLRTGLLRQGRYWATLGIALGFQVLVDGWLTRPDATVVHYDPARITGVRFPFDIPVEDWGFGFALVTLTLGLWRWHQLRGGGQDA